MASGYPGNIATVSRVTEQFFTLAMRLASAFDGERVLGPKFAIILALHEAESEGFIHNFTSLAREVDLPYATMLRHLNEAVSENWAILIPHHTDRRVKFVRLSPDIIRRIENALHATSE